jgi:hypothetical protein
MVENQTWRSGCWDDPEYTTSMDIYLTPEMTSPQKLVWTSPNSELASLKMRLYRF